MQPYSLPEIKWWETLFFLFNRINKRNSEWYNEWVRGVEYGISLRRRNQLPPRNPLYIIEGAYFERLFVAGQNYGYYHSEELIPRPPDKISW